MYQGGFWLLLRLSAATLASRRSAAEGRLAIYDRSQQMTTPQTISEGATGPTVRWAQYLLVRRTLSDSQIDGIFGPVTKAAVGQFQHDAHLSVDGIYGPHTSAAVEGTQHLGGISADGVVGLQTWALPVHAAGQVLANLCGVPGPGGA
jgi:peptidoglycan hydrolase-like protein with peptidoglycan-binding domain